MPKCSKCSTDNRNNNKFCRECGADLKAQKKKKKQVERKQNQKAYDGKTLVSLIKFSMFLKGAALLFFGYSLFLYNDLLLTLNDDSSDNYYGFLKHKQFSIPFAVFILFGLIGIVSSVIYMRKKHKVDKLMIFFFVIQAYALAFIPMVGPLFALIFASMLIKNKGMPGAMKTSGDPHIAIATNTHQMLEKKVMGKPALYTAGLLIIAALWQPVSFIARYSMELGIEVQSLIGYEDDDYININVQKDMTFSKGKILINKTPNFYRMDIEGSATVKFENCSTDFHSMSIKEASTVNFDSCRNAFHSIDITEEAYVTFDSCKNVHKFIDISGSSMLTFNNCNNEFHSIDFKGNSKSAYNVCDNQFHSIDIKENAELSFTDCKSIFYSIEITESGRATFNNSSFMHGYNTATLANIVAIDSAKLVFENCTIPSDGYIRIYIRNNAEVVLRNCTVPLTAVNVDNNSTLVLDNVVVVAGNNNSIEYLRKSFHLRNNSVLILKNTPVVFKIDLDKNATIVQYDKSFRKTKYSYIYGDVLTINSNEHDLTFAEIADIYRKKYSVQ